MTVASMPMKSPLTRSMPLAAPDMPAEDVPAANDHGRAHALPADLGDIGGYGIERRDVDAVAPASHQGLARDLDQRTLVGQWRHCSLQG